MDSRRRFLSKLAGSATCAMLHCSAYATSGDDFAPGWLPINRLDDERPWSKSDDCVRLYLPPGDKPVRGVFVCFVFHSSDPRELARLWNFALVTVPWPFEYDLGVNDKRNGRSQLGHALGNMGRLLKYLETASRETKHPELASVPLVGWLGQNGSHLSADLYDRAPDRVLAWSDSFPDRLRQFPKLTNNVPFAFAWEISKTEERDRRRTYSNKDQPTEDLSCRANTYGFGHGIYSKYNFFAAYLDRCIRLRMPKELPPPGEPVKILPVVRDEGWVGDFDPVSEWNPIAPAKSAAAKAMKYPSWLPDEYAAWMWRSYHSSQPDLKLTGPVVEYSKSGDKWGGPRCGLGYGGYLSADQLHTFTAQTTGEYDQVEFHDGNRLLGVSDNAPWQLSDVKLAPGLHSLFVAGVSRMGTRTASRPAFAIVR